MTSSATEKIKILPICDEDNYTIGYYVKGIWDMNLFRQALYYEYTVIKARTNHGYFRFISNRDNTTSSLRFEQESKQSNFPVTVAWLK